MDDRFAEILLAEIRGVRDRLDEVHDVLSEAIAQKADKSEMIEVRKELTQQGKDLFHLKGKALGVSAAVSALVSLGPVEITKSIFKSTFSNG